MTRYLAIGIIGLAALVGACGSDDEEQASGAAVGSADTVAVKDMSGVGRVLVDASGAALYTADQEEDGKVRCVDDCLTFWLPVIAPESGPPTGGDGVTGKLDVIERNDGARQVTYDGKPVYRFSEDPPGEVTGDGFEDDFGGKTFSWNAITVGGGDSGGDDEVGAPGDYGY
jgi:predicted lipoprotein with Yx(FWY)xxD motif